MERFRCAYAGVYMSRRRRHRRHSRYPGARGDEGRGWVMPGRTDWPGRCTIIQYYNVIHFWRTGEIRLSRAPHNTKYKYTSQSLIIYYTIIIFDAHMFRRDARNFHTSVILFIYGFRATGARSVLLPITPDNNISRIQNITSNISKYYLKRKIIILDSFRATTSAGV